MLEPNTDFQKELRQKVQQLWQTDFPLSNAMQMQLVSFTDHIITTRSNLAPNTNTHGTAFAGSLYAIEALTAWSLLYMELATAGIDASIIHASGNIEFAKPVREDIVASASFAGHEEALTQLREKGKTKLSLTTTVQADGELASQFEGVYVVRNNT